MGTAALSPNDPAFCHVISTLIAVICERIAAKIGYDSWRIFCWHFKAQRLLYEPQDSTSKYFTFRQNGSQNIQRLMPYTAFRDWFCATEVESVYCAVRTESLYKTDTFHISRINTDNRNTIVKRFQSTQWSTVLLKFSQKKFPAFYRMQMFVSVGGDSSVGIASR